ncbi:MAG: DUF1570 domain-containing protein [Bryobacterales bacterium]|nr:DUF1570 domain-containing protein [Bryobacterales bacterium]
MRRIWCILWLAAGTLAAAKEKEWTAAASDHFELVTTGGARKARAGILHFEEVRDFFVRALGFDPKLRQKVRLVAFDSAEEWKRFRPGEAAIAFYQSGLDRDTIAMESLRGEVYQTAVHEYVHLLLRHSGGSFPLWLNEGLAELYSSMNVSAGKMRVGDLHVGRFQLLHSSKWLPMEQLATVDHDSPIYRAKGHAGIFYSQSWALAHMLMLGEAYRPKAGELVRQVAFADVPTAKAFQNVYGKTLFQVQKDLESYLSANSIRIMLFDYKPEKPPQPDVRAASRFESELAIARLLSHEQGARDADEIFERLEETNKDDLQLAEAYGFHLLRKRPAEARARLERAVAAGSVNPKVYTQYAFLVQGEDAGKAVTALRKAVELEPGDKELRYFLGRMQLQAKRPGEALSTLTEARPVPPEHAVGYLETLAYVYLQFKKPEEARKLLARVRELAKSPDDERRAAALERNVQQWEDYDAQRKAAEERYAKYKEAQTQAGNEAAVPTIRRGDAEPAPAEKALIERTAEAGSTLPKVAGKLRMVDCRGAQAILHLVVDGKLRRFRIDDAGAVVITGTGVNGSTVDFSCGAQKDVPVTLGILPQPDARTATEGLVRTLGF